MSEQSPHPTREELSAYSLGQLPQEEAVAIDSHISECQPCCETIVGISSDDTFVGLLKEARQLQTDQTVDHGVATASSSQDVPTQLAEHPRYEIVRLIGKGGMGDVYKARHRRMERTVALKVINRGLVRQTEAVDRFHREVKAAAQLSHPNIVIAYDADQAGDFHFMVMEYVDGVDLSQTIKDRGALPVVEACDYIRQAAIGLQHAHERGMVHRDIKPHNLMVMSDGTVKILDFGLASIAPEALSDVDTVEARGDLTAAGAIMGTPDFISPEQANDARQADIRSDIYSLGTTLYFLLSGQPPFADGSVMHKLKSHAQVEPEPLDSLSDDIPSDLEAVVSKMMAKDPDERIQTPAEVAAALEPFATGADLSALGSQVEDLPRRDASAASADEIPVMMGSAGNVLTSDNDNDQRGPRAWLWLGWAAVATAFVCLGLTIASMTTAYEMTAGNGGPAAGLTQGIWGSLRYMSVGGPAFFIGVIVLIVAYIRIWAKSSPQLRPTRTRIVGIAVVLLVAGMALGQIVVRVQHEDGSSTAVVLPQGSRAIIDEQGNVEVSPPDVKKTGSRIERAQEGSAESGSTDAPISSPDGTMIAYAKPDEDGDTEIFVARRDGSDARQLTDNDSTDIQPDWSPDGKRIAFASMRQGTWQVYVMDRDGSNFKNVSERSINAHTPQFGPDGRIAFVSYERDMGRFLEVDLKVSGGGGPEKVVAANTPIAEFAWHPKGKFLVYTTSETPNLPGRIVFYRPDDETSKVVLYTDIDKRLQFHRAHDIGWHLQTNSIPVGGGKNFRVNGKIDWVACRITPSQWGPLGGGLGLDKGEVFIISPHGEAHLVPVGRAMPAASDTTMPDRTRVDGEQSNESRTTRDSQTLAVSRLDGSWRLAQSKNAKEEKGAGTRADIIIDINPAVVAKLPKEFKDKLDERGISIMTSGYMTYKREEQLFAVVDWNGDLKLQAFAAEAPHAFRGDALIKLETAPDKQDDQLLISEEHEDDEPFENYQRRKTDRK